MIFMARSPEKSKAGIKDSAVPKRRFVPRILHRRISFLRLAISTLVACFLCSSFHAVAQEDRPEITPLERKLQKKKDTGPRAIALLQMSDKGKSSLVPIAILINGKFWDASSYKADPVPMALDPGTIYEAEQSGDSLGLFTVGSALHSNAVNAQAPWLATGTWVANGTVASTKGLKAATVPVGMEDTDGPPRLTRNSGTNSPSGPPNSTNASAPSPPPSKPTSSGDGDGPPRLTKSTPPPSTDPNATQPSPASPKKPPDSSKPADSNPDDTKSVQAKTDTQPKIPVSDSGTPEADRPILRRGKPAESFADEDVPGYSKPGRISSTPAKVAGPAAPMSDLKLIPAISDAGGPAPHSYIFEWLKGEEGDRQKQMMQMAKDQLHAYLAALKKETIVPKSAHSAATHHPSRPAEPIFESVKMVAYDLWNANIPIIVFSATAHMPPAAPSVAHSEFESNQQYSILLVAYPDIYQNLHKLYSGVTDRFHLDVTPRLDLVDAVDADGDGQGELLFRETSDSGTGWIIYRATADKLWKLYDSLSPQ